MDVADGSIAQNVGFQPGDIIDSVNGKKIEKTRDLERATMENEPRLADRAAARRKADFGGVERMSPRAKPKGEASLFQAAGA